MVLKAIRLLQWLIGIALFAYGVYLIFGVQEFFGTIAIIAAFLIFPSLETKKAAASKHYSNDPYYASAYDTDESDDWDSDDDDSNEDSGGDSDDGGNDD